MPTKDTEARIDAQPRPVPLDSEILQRAATMLRTGERDPTLDPGDEPALHEVTATICSLCLDGAGGECHVPGCVFWCHDAPAPADRGATLRSLLIGVGSIDGVTTYPALVPEAGES